MIFTPERLKSRLSSIEQPSRYIVAYSGGVDSLVLLHAMSCLAQSKEDFPKIIAAHIHHGLNTDADDWSAHCRIQAIALGVNYIERRVDVQPAQGDSLEEIAREARYQALSELCKEDDLLLLAQHADDQAETVLLQLLRGAGVPGLAAMPEYAKFGRANLYRPLLDARRAELVAYAKLNSLNWIEDSSNQDRSFDRNYLRHEVLPLIKSRWPSAAQVISRSANHFAEADTLLKTVAADDLCLSTGDDGQTLSIQSLLNLDQTRQRNLLRYWIQVVQSARLPDTKVFNRIFDELLHCRADRSPKVHWGPYEIRRYRGHLYFLHSPSDSPEGWKAHWSVTEVLALPPGLGELRLASTDDSGLSMCTLLESEIEVGFRVGGERLHPVGSGCTRELKKLYQEKGIPPWERAQIPLIYIDQKLAAVADLWMDKSYLAQEGESGLKIEWFRGRR